MNYKSTRGNDKGKTAAEAIKMGLGADGGLFMPEEIPTLSEEEILKLCECDYAHRAAYILSKFLTDYTYEELLSDCQVAYGKDNFGENAAPVVGIEDNLNVLELWHGPTSAFKDMALQIMPKLLSRALVKTGEKRRAFILVATSGDTGKAALEGYRDIEGIDIMVYYPVDGVSKIQKLQMATQAGDNVSVCSIVGNFDDAQNGVKKIFSDAEVREKLDKSGYFLSSANSINWGRLAPQVVYYVSAYCDLVGCGKIKMCDGINVCVPTGNFGNIFAAYLAKKMGLPINKLICASNSNKILTDFFTTGKYDKNRDFYTTMSPSMDILISSNLERLLYLIFGEAKTKDCMKQLADTGCYKISCQTRNKIGKDFVGMCCNEEETMATIKKIFDEDKYLCDTHTAVALKCAKEYIENTGDKTQMVVASTASPYKFASSVCRSLGLEVTDDEFECLSTLSSYTKTEIPVNLASLKEKKVRFDKTIKADKMTDEVYSQLKINLK